MLKLLIYSLVITVPWYAISVNCGVFDIKLSEIILLLILFLSLFSIKIVKNSYITLVVGLLFLLIIIIFLQGLWLNRFFESLKFAVVHFIILLMFIIIVANKRNINSIMQYTKISYYVMLVVGLFSYFLYKFWEINFNIHVYIANEIRTVSLMTDPNRFANFVVAFWPFIFFGTHQNHLFKLNLRQTLILAVSFFIIISTGSRGALLAFIFQSALLSLVSQKNKIYGVFVFTISLLILGCLFYYFVILHPLIRNNLSEIDLIRGNLRFQYWYDGFLQFTKHPFWGIGFGDIISVTDLFFPSYELHNTFLTVLFQGGLFYTIIFILLIAAVIKLNMVCYEDNSNIIKLFIISYFGIFIHSFFINIHIERYIWLVFALNFAYVLQTCNNVHCTMRSSKSLTSKYGSKYEFKNAPLQT